VIDLDVVVTVMRRVDHRVRVKMVISAEIALDLLVLELGYS